MYSLLHVITFHYIFITLKYVSLYFIYIFITFMYSLLHFITSHCIYIFLTFSLNGTTSLRVICLPAHFRPSNAHTWSGHVNEVEGEKLAKKQIYRRRMVIRTTQRIKNVVLLESSRWIQCHRRVDDGGSLLSWRTFTLQKKDPSPLHFHLKTRIISAFSLLAATLTGWENFSRYCCLLPNWLA